MPHQHEEGWECPECHMKRGVDMTDPCLGKLPGVKYACCGHGGAGYTIGYIYFENGVTIRFGKLNSVEYYDGHPKCQQELV